MSQHVELEAHIQAGRSGYEIDLRLTQPGSDAEIQPLKGGSRDLAIDLDALRQASADMARYGEVVSALLFDDEVTEAFQRALDMANAFDQPLRVRLRLPSDAPALHAIHWEQVVYPRTKSPLLMREDVFFSRFLPSDDLRRIPQRPRRELRALIVVASPDDREGRWPQFGQVNAAEERQRAGEAMAGLIPVSGLAPTERATLDTITKRLREGFDVFYLVCHGGINPTTSQP
ncbi:MAG: CHAT domain-containing protein, partial [Vicinamibacterales bacterium]